VPAKVKVSSKGQVVIPKPVREGLNLREGDELLLVRTKEGVLLRRPTDVVVGLRGLLKDVEADAAECERILSEARQSLSKHFRRKTLAEQT